MNISIREILYFNQFGKVFTHESFQLYRTLPASFDPHDPPGVLRPTLTSFSSSETTWGLTAFQLITRPQLPSRMQQKFMEDLGLTIDNISLSDMLLVMGDFNGVGCER